jgi:hypothetical protein
MVKKVKRKTVKRVVKKVVKVAKTDPIKVKETQLAKAVSAFEIAKARVVTANDKYKSAAEKAKLNRRAASIKSAKRARELMSQAMVKRNEAAARCKVARDALQETKRQIRAKEMAKRLSERKETAKQKAIATFERKWEREWDKKMRVGSKPKPQAVRASA